jgi:hypothetical protein
MKRLSLCACCAAIALQICATAQAVTVSLVPRTSSIVLGGANDPVLVDLVVSNPTNTPIKSWSLDLHFEAGVLNTMSAASGGFQVGDYISGVYPVWTEHYKNSTDTARMLVTNFGSARGTASTGVLATLKLDALALSGGTTISLTQDVGGLAGDSGSVSTTLQGATITITPEPATVLLLGLGMVLNRRRR